MPLRLYRAGVGCLAVVASLLALLTACKQDRPATASTPASEVVEIAPRTLPLGAPLSERDIEISGLTWYGDTLVVLPQYPARYAPNGQRQLYGIARAALERAVADSTAGPLQPFAIPLDASGIASHESAYEGCEAVTFVGRRAYLLVESASRGPGMHAQMLHGTVASGLSKITLQTTAAREVPVQASLSNMSYEALTTHGDTVVALFEANGARVNATPRAHRFGPPLERHGTVSFPTLEYRLTDATAPDNTGRFWVINYFYPGERDLLKPAPDSVAMAHRPGATHRASDVVERLVEYRHTPTGIRRTDTPPVWLKLGGGTGRNWEGVVRFGDGFLVATDKFPSTMLAYVPRP